MFISLSNLLVQMRRSPGLRHSALTIFSYVFASGFSALAIILISRLLGPTSFADFSVAFSLSLILNRLNDFGLSIVLQKFVGNASKDFAKIPLVGQIAQNLQRRQINAYLSLVLKLRLALSIIIVTVGLICAEAIASYLQISNPLLIPLSFIFSVSVAHFEFAQITLQSLGQFKLAAYNYLLPALIKFGMALLVFLMQVHNTQLILSIYLLSTLPSLLIAELLKPKWIKYQLEQNFKKEQAKVLALLRHSAFAVISAGIIDNIDILFAKHYLSAYEAGLLSGVGRIAMLLYVVAYALANVLNPRAATYHDRANLNSFLKKAWGIAALAGLGFLVTLPLAPFLIHWTVGPQYATGSGILIILMATGFISIALTPFIASFYAFKHNSFFSQSALLQLAIVLFGNFYFVPQFGLTASVYTRLIARATLLVFTWWMLWRSYWRKLGDANKKPLF